MRIVSWNIKFGRDIDGAVDHLRSRPELVGADVVLAQELDGDGAARLADALGMANVYHPSVVHPQTGRPFGNAVLSPHELLARPPVALPHRAGISGVDRSVVVAEVVTTDGIVAVASAHTEIPLLSLRRRRQQFDTVARATDPATGPVVVGGDFNTGSPRSRRALDETMRANGFVRIGPGDEPTLRRLGVGLRLDHLFGRGVRAVDAGVAPLHPASDHAPIHAVVELDPDASGG